MHATFSNIPESKTPNGTRIGTCRTLVFGVSLVLRLTTTLSSPTRGWRPPSLFSAQGSPLRSVNVTGTVLFYLGSYRKLGMSGISYTVRSITALTYNSNKHRSSAIYPNMPIYSVSAQARQAHASPSISMEKGTYRIRPPRSRAPSKLRDTHASHATAFRNHTNTTPSQSWATTL